MIDSIVLGIVQGITEWLPVSSSGHLVLFEKLLGLKPSLEFNIALHFASLLVVLVYFHKEILDLARKVLKKDKDALYMAAYIVLGTLPIVFVGLGLRNLIEKTFTSDFIGVSLVITSMLLLATLLKKDNKVLDWKKALLIGAAQSIAIVPGISRSGFTIAAGVLLGVKRKQAALFSFYLSIPAILGASVLELGNISSLNVMQVSVGMITTFVIGLAAIKILLRTLDKLHYYAFYCGILGIVLLIV